MSNEVLFNTENFKDNSNRIINYCRANITDNHFTNELYRHLEVILISMRSNIEKWDSLTSWNKNATGKLFSNLLNESDHWDLQKIYVLSLRYAIEVDLKLEDNLNDELQSAIDFGLNNIDHFNKACQAQISFICTRMPIQIVKNVLNGAEIKSILDLSEIYNKTHISLNETMKDVETKRSELLKIKESLEKYESAYNFVGLYEGFDALSKSISRNSTTLMGLINTVALALVFIPLIEIFVILKYDIVTSNYIRIILP